MEDIKGKMGILMTFYPDEVAKAWADIKYLGEIEFTEGCSRERYIALDAYGLDKLECFDLKSAAWKIHFGYNYGGRIVERDEFLDEVARTQSAMTEYTELVDKLVVRHLWSKHQIVGLSELTIPPGAVDDLP